jgi:hypothetical protein
MVECRKIKDRGTDSRIFHPPPKIFCADVNYSITKGAHAVAGHARRNLTINVENFGNIRNLPFSGEAGPQFIIFWGLSGWVSRIHPDGFYRRLSQHDRTMDERVVEQKIEL